MDTVLANVVQERLWWAYQDNRMHACIQMYQCDQKHSFSQLNKSLLMQNEIYHFNIEFFDIKSKREITYTDTIFFIFSSNQL